MSPRKILIDENGHSRSPTRISAEIRKFGNSYNDATNEIIINSIVLDDEGKVFIKCTSRILSNFGMTRRGPFYGTSRDKNLRRCWNEVGTDLIEINKSVLESGLSRDRYILEISNQKREELIAKIWLITKRLLPITMGKTSYGLVGASKILFSVLPEIALPVDNTEWLHVFQTVDFGDVLHYMVSDIQKWEEITGRRLNELDPAKRLTTLPSVYNVMAMAARPKIVEIEKNRFKITETPQEKEMLSRQIESTDGTIDRLVYTSPPSGMMYDLSREEIKIVEGNK